MSSNHSNDLNAAQNNLSVGHILAAGLSLAIGISMSVWLAIDPPQVTPTRTSYLPAD